MKPLTHYTKTPQQGVSLMELLLSLVTASIMCVVGVHLYKQALSISKVWHEEKQLLRTTVTVGGYLQGILDDFDSHRLPLLPRVASGDLTFIDGSRIPILGTPHRDTRSIFSFELCRMSPIEITHRARIGNTVVGRACFTRNDQCGGSPPFGAIGVSPGGAVEIEMTSENTPSPCKEVQLRSTRGVVVKGASPDELLSISKVLITKRAYTLYLNDKAELRWIGFRGDTVIEHQPLAKDISPFTVHFSLLPNQIIEGSLSIKQNAPPLYFTNTLSRRDVINILFL